MMDGWTCFSFFARKRKKPYVFYSTYPKRLSESRVGWGRPSWHGGHAERNSLFERVRVCACACVSSVGLFLLSEFAFRVERTAFSSRVAGTRLPHVADDLERFQARPAENPPLDNMLQISLRLSDPRRGTSESRARVRFRKMGGGGVGALCFCILSVLLCTIIYAPALMERPFFLRGQGIRGRVFVFGVCVG